jgi:hypothetical protein
MTSSAETSSGDRDDLPHGVRINTGYRLLRHHGFLSLAASPSAGFLNATLADLRIELAKAAPAISAPDISWSS